MIVKNRSTETGRKFWDHIESVAWTAGGVNPTDIDRDILEHGRVEVEKKIVVPDGMLKAVSEAQRTSFCPLTDYGMLEAALRWLIQELQGMTNGDPQSDYDSALEDVKAMFLAPEPEIPEKVKDLLAEESAHPLQQRWMDTAKHNKQILEAYRRGKAATNLDKFKDFK